VLRAALAAVVGAQRFLAEIRTTANLQHPHILPLFDSGEVEGTVFYVMPYVEEESLRHGLAREKQLPVGDALRIAGEIAGALDYAHRHGVIHRYPGTGRWHPRARRAARCSPLIALEGPSIRGRAQTTPLGRATRALYGNGSWPEHAQRENGMDLKPIPRAGLSMQEVEEANANNLDQAISGQCSQRLSGVFEQLRELSIRCAGAARDLRQHGEIGKLQVTEE
jgi:hypothetical protein